VARKSQKCPNCGSLFPRDAPECPQCGHREGQQELDTLLRALRVDRAKAAESPKERDRVSGMLYLCGGCGAFVDAGATACAKCGTPLDFEEEAVPEDAASAPPSSPLGAVGEGKAVCAQCGAILATGVDACVVCGAPAQPAEAPAAAAPAPSEATCNTCGATLGTDGVCPICSAIEVFTARGTTPSATRAPAPAAPAPVPAEEPPVRPIEPAPEPEPPQASPLKKARRRRDYSEPLRREAPVEEPVEPPELPAKVPEPALPVVEVLPEPVEVVVEAPRKPARGEVAPAEEEPEAAPAEEAPEETATSTEAEELEAEDLYEPKARSAATAVEATDPFEADAESEPLPPRPRSVHPRIVQYGEISVYSAAVGLALGVVTAVLALPFWEYVLLALFGSLFAVGVSLLAASARGLAGGKRWTGVAVAGTVAVALLPVRWILGGPLVPELDGLLLALGTGAILGGAVRIGHPSSVLLPSTAGLWHLLVLGLLPMMFPTVAPLAPTALWLSGGFLVASAAALALEGRFVQSRAEQDVEAGRAVHRDLDPEGSLVSYDRAIRRSRRSATGASESAWTSKGAALILLGRYDEAIACLDKALQIDPADPVAWLNRGNALARKAEFAEALWCFNQALGTNPRYEVAWNNKGNTLARLGKYDEALKCYERALTIDRNYRGAWVNKGFVLAKLGHFEEAAMCADRVLTIAGKGGASVS